MTTLRADLHVHSRASTADRQHAVPQEPRLLLVAGGRLSRGQGARHGSRHAHRSRHHRRLSRISFRASGRPGLHHGRGSVVPLPGHRPRSASGRLRHDRGAAPGVQPLRRNVFDVAACLREAGVFFALNHLLFFYRGQVPLDATSRCSTRSRPSKRETARCCRRTTISSPR